MLKDLREERDAINEAIISLERLAEGRGRRRGRPPTWLADARKDEPAAGSGADGAGAKRGRRAEKGRAVEA